MSRYRGKREAPRPERGFGRKEETFLQQDPFLEETEGEAEQVEEPLFRPVSGSQQEDDPFAEEDAALMEKGVRRKYCTAGADFGSPKKERFWR